MPAELLMRRQERAHQRALEQMDAAQRALPPQASGGVPLHEQVQARIELDDIAELSSLAEVDLVRQEEALQRELGARGTQPHTAPGRKPSPPGSDCCRMPRIERRCSRQRLRGAHVFLATKGKR